MPPFIKRWFDRLSLSAPPVHSGDGRAYAVVQGRPGHAMAALSAEPDEPLCPLPQPLPLTDARRVLVFAPHPDDESIGCGGLIARLLQAAVPVRVVLVTDGAGAGGLPPGAAQVRQQEFHHAVRQLGGAQVALLGFEDGALADGEALDGAVRQQLADFAPNWVVMPALADLHRDHRVLARTVVRAAQAQPGVQALWQYETWAALPVTHVLDIGDVLPAKRAAIAEHHTALACGNYLEGALGLAAYRGLLLGASRPGAAAEGFVLTNLS